MSHDNNYYTSRECRAFAPAYWDAFQDEYSMVAFDNCKEDQEALVSRFRDPGTVKRPYRKLAVLLRAYVNRARAGVRQGDACPEPVVDDWRGSFVVRFRPVKPRL